MSLLLGAIVLMAGVALWLLSAPRPVFAHPRRAAIPAGGDVEQGRLLFNAADCASCHASPGQSDRLRLGGGLALAAPFGTLRVPNISPDPRDGIGLWSTADLANALLSGVSPRGTHYYPAFPYTFYTHLRLSDVQNLMAYLRTLPPVAGRPPGHDLPFPFNIRRTVGIWKVLYFKRAPLRVDPTRSRDWNRGRYLVEGAAHCADCHSSRNLLGALKPATRYAGGQDPQGVGFVPDITAAGLPGWGEEQWTRFLRSGQTPDLRIIGSSMAEVLTNLAMLPESDRRAMAVYLLTLQARPAALP